MRVERECFFCWSSSCWVWAFLLTLWTEIFICWFESHQRLPLSRRLHSLPPRLGWWFNDTRAFAWISLCSDYFPVLVPNAASPAVLPVTEDSKERQLGLLEPVATAEVSASLNSALGSREVRGILCRTGAKVPNEQKLLGEDGCSANEFVAAHITETSIIISSLTECLNKNEWAWRGEILVPLKSMAKPSPTSKGHRFMLKL